MATKPAAKVSTSTFDPSKVVVKRQLITPTLKLDPGVQIFVKVTGKMFVGKASTKKDDDGQVRKPATILPVICLHAGENHEHNGEACQVVANKVLISTLNEEFPKDGYVGKSFRITKAMEKTSGAGGEYYKFTIAEID